MEPFYLIVIGIATMILILILIFVGLLMQTGKKNVVYPPIANTCPDNWTVASDGFCEIPGSKNSNFGKKSDRNELKKTLTPYIKSDLLNANKLDPNDSNWTSNGKTTICQQKAWSNNNNILWDGVSNYNSCK